MAPVTRRLRIAVLAAVLVALPSSTAVAGTLSVALDPAYGEATGANGWYRTPVTATYTCAPALLETVVSCPPGEVLGDGAGTAPDGAPAPVTRTAVFERVGTGTSEDTVTLESAPGVPLRIDAQAPPPPVITSPADALVVRPGALLTAAFTCTFTGDRSGAAPVDACTGTVPAGQPLDTGSADPATWGARAFVATARDAAGNVSTATAGYRIEAEPVPPAPPPPSAPPVAPVSAAVAAPPALAPAPARASRLPRLRNARALRPLPGGRVPPRALLRWPRAGGAALYNVQVFRITGTRYVKVLSAFPRANRLRVPAGRLRPGQRYAWRIWPFNGRLRAYTRAPVGVSWFRVVRPARR